MLDELNTAIAQANTALTGLQSQLDQLTAAVTAAIIPIWIVQVGQITHGFPNEKAASDFAAASTGSPVWRFTTNYTFHPAS